MSVLNTDLFCIFTDSKILNQKPFCSHII